MYTECKLIADALALSIAEPTLDQVSFIGPTNEVRSLGFSQLPGATALYQQWSSAASEQKTANYAKLLDIYLTLADQGCELIDLTWKGYREFYTVKLPTGRIVQRNIRSLQRSGVATQIEHDERCFAAFKQVCEDNGAELLIKPSDWLGVKTYYPVRQPDGLVIKVMPNTAMNYAWRRCALVELRQMAAPYEVTLITRPEANPQLFKLDFGQGLCFDGTRVELSRILQVKERLTTVATWLKEQEYWLSEFNGSMDWSKRILVQRSDGRTKKVPSPFQTEFDERRKVGLLRRRGRSYGVELIDTKWKGQDATYSWKTTDGDILEMKQDYLPSYRGLNKLREKGAQVGACLLSTQYVSSYSTYKWNYKGKVFKATVKALERKVQELM